MGYAGNDRGVMIDFFQKHLREDPRFLENGLYWCFLRGTEVPPLVQALCAMDPKHERVQLVEIEGFDQALDLLAQSFSIPPDEHIMAESLRHSQSCHALLLEAVSLGFDSHHKTPPSADILRQIFAKLVGTLGASSGALVVRDRATAALRVSHPVKDTSVYTTVSDSLWPSRVENLSESHCLSAAVEGFPPPGLIRAYPITRATIALFAFERRELCREQDDSLIQAVCLLLCRLLDRLESMISLSSQQDWHLAVSRQAQMVWDQLGQPANQDQQIWLRAENELLKKYIKSSTE